MRSFLPTRMLVEVWIGKPQVVLRWQPTDRRRAGFRAVDPPRGIGRRMSPTLARDVRTERADASRESEFERHAHFSKKEVEYKCSRRGTEASVEIEGLA